MAFYRIFPSKDTWITTQYFPNSVTTRATGSNHGKSPSLSVFAAKGESVQSQTEVARALVQFSLTELSGKIYSEKTIPSSSVSYYLRMFDMKHEDTLASSYDLFVYPLSKSWDEGNGVDDNNFRDGGFCNWINSTSTVSWAVTGSDFLTGTYGSASQHFDSGGEDLEVDVTDVVKNWLTASIPNYGVVVKMGSAEENNAANYYNKKFHGAQSKYVDRLPYIEARWNDVTKDNRANFSLGAANTLYLYNVVRGTLTSMSEPIILKLQDHIHAVSSSLNTQITASQISTGIATASIELSTTGTFSSSFYEVWFSGSKVFYSGSFTHLTLTASSVDQYDEFVVDVVNLKRTYQAHEEARLKASVRKKNYRPHLRSVHSASMTLPREYVETMYYSIQNDETGETVVPFGTGSLNHTQLSYNSDGNFFNLWMSSFVPGFKYRIKFLININRYEKVVIDDEFTFKVI